MSCNSSKVVDEKSKIGTRDKKIENMAPALAHGIRNPLNIIKGAVVCLRDGYSGKRVLGELADIIEEEINRIDHFVAGFLGVSSCGAGMSDVDINQLLEKLRMSLGRRKGGDVFLFVCGYGEIPVIRANPFLIEQAILSIVSKMAGAAGSGGEIEVATTAINRSGSDFVRIRLSGTGPLIVSDGAGRLSPHEGAVENPGENGLGLLIAREVIKSHGGEIEIESDSATGMTFTLYLPSQ